MMCVISGWIAIGLYSLGVRGDRVACPLRLDLSPLGIFKVCWIKDGFAGLDTPVSIYVEPGVHLADWSKHLQATRTTYGVRPSPWICHSNILEHTVGRKTQIADSSIGSLPPELLHPIYSITGWSLWWTDLIHHRSACRVNNGNGCLLWNFSNQNY